MIWFTADEHLGHENIINYCSRPFNSVEEMDGTIIENHNALVCGGDTVYHLGDFAWNKNYSEVVNKYVKRLNGSHIFLLGSHDRWLTTIASINPRRTMIELKLNKVYIVLCHYAFKVWPRSHYNSWNLFGHSHGRLKPEGKQWDVGVDNNNFRPVSFDQLKKIMAGQPDNFNLVKR